MFKVSEIMPRLIVAILLVLGSGLSYAADPNKGAELYARHCVACHGASGISNMPGTPNFAKSEGLMNSDPALLISIRSGKAAMPAYRGVLSDQDILDVIAYLRSFY
jgi:cytochrome c6